MGVGHNEVSALCPDETPEISYGRRVPRYAVWPLLQGVQMIYPVYVTVSGVKWWHCEKCSVENKKGDRCKICGCTVRQRRKK